MNFIYTLFIHIYTAIIVIASKFSPKAKLWIDGRKDWRKIISDIDFKGKRFYWFHCASLGEFEQGRPLMERIRENQPDTKIVLTFFSPSGYELRKNYHGAHYILYLPADTPSNARFMIKCINPDAVFFVKYEFWFNYLKELKKNKINTYLISGIFRPEQHFFKWYGAWQRKQLQAFTKFFLQNKESITLLKNIGFNNVYLSGDTRFDRVVEQAALAKNLENIGSFKNNKPVLIAGSTWAVDDEMLHELYIHFINNKMDIKIIITPHQIYQKRIQNIIDLFGKQNVQKYSNYNTKDNSKNILIIDNIGMLSSLYKYGEVAYIGGGFGKGIHNTLEAAVYGIPVVFGPNYINFKEATDLINIKGGIGINNTNEAVETITSYFNNEQLRINAGKVNLEYVYSHIGATKVILDEIVK